MWRNTNKLLFAIVGFFVFQAEDALAALPDLQLQPPSVLTERSGPDSWGFQLDIEREASSPTLAMRPIVRRSAVVAARVGMKSPVTAWALSFFLQFGSGNYYARAIPVAVICTIGEILGWVFLISGVVYGWPGMWVPALIGLVGMWVFDWVFAIHAANTFNARVNAIRSARELPPVLAPRVAGSDEAFYLPSVVSF